MRNTPLRAFASPAKQYDYTVTDTRSEEVIQKEKDEIEAEKERKKKDQERINQQIEGTYVQTEEDVKERQRLTELHFPTKRP